MTCSGTFHCAVRPIHCVNLPSPGSRFIRAAIAGAALLVATVMAAAETPFSEGLSPQERGASGVARLTPAERATLDGLVGRDVILARQGGVTGFSSTFAARRTPKERIAAGMDRLSEAERSNLDAFAARAIASPPPPSDTFAYEPRPAPPGMEEVLVTAPPKLQVHGDLSVTVGGGGHGSSFFGTSEDLFVTDPSGRFTVGIGFSEFKGKGFFGPYGLYNPVLCGPPFGDW
jgi:hypothetical protein